MLSCILATKAAVPAVDRTSGETDLADFSGVGIVLLEDKRKAKDRIFHSVAVRDANHASAFSFVNGSSPAARWLAYADAV